MSDFLSFYDWGYQNTYYRYFKKAMKDSLEIIGASVDPIFLTVNVPTPDAPESEKVHIYPKEFESYLVNFDNILVDIEDHFKWLLEDDPSISKEEARQLSVQQIVMSAMKSDDECKEITSMFGDAVLLKSFYVVPVVQIRNEIFKQFPKLPPKEMIGCELHDRFHGFRSFIHATAAVVLHEATDELRSQSPLRERRSAKETVEKAAMLFIGTPARALKQDYFIQDIWEILNHISVQLYEGNESRGRIIFAGEKSDSVKYDLTFNEPVPLDDLRWVIKVIQMTNSNISVISDFTYIYGLGQLRESYDPMMQDVFVVDIIGHYHWQLNWNGRTLIRSKNRHPMLPQEPVNEAAFIAQHERLFPNAKPGSSALIWELLTFQAQQDHGSMIVIASDAKEEALRLKNQGTTIVPVLMTPSLLLSVTSIDGTILLDPDGICFAIGVILDGAASVECTASRGSRYNSGIRYVQAGKKNRFAMIASDDRTIDIIPKPKLLISRKILDKKIQQLRDVDLENYLELIEWLDKHRFYMDSKQCEKINVAIVKFNRMIKEKDIIYWPMPLFLPDSEMNNSYLID